VRSSATRGALGGIALMLACGSLLPLPLAASAEAKTAGARSAVDDDRAIEDLQRRLRSLAEQLDEIHDRGGSAAETRARKHWQDVQAYALQTQRLAQNAEGSNRAPALPRHSGTDCGLPSRIDIAGYSAKMGDILLHWREALMAIHQLAPGDARAQRMQQYAQAADRDLDSLRVQLWLGPHTAPTAEQDLPEAPSEGAYLVRHYCSQCHAAPAPALHTASEWYDVAASMRTHIGIANAGRVAAAQPPSALEMNLIETYLQTYACQPARGDAP